MILNPQSKDCNTENNTHQAVQMNPRRKGTTVSKVLEETKPHQDVHEQDGKMHHDTVINMVSNDIGQSRQILEN